MDYSRKFIKSDVLKNNREANRYTSPMVTSFLFSFFKQRSCFYNPVFPHGAGARARRRAGARAYG